MCPPIQGPRYAHATTGFEISRSSTASLIPGGDWLRGLAGRPSFGHFLLTAREIDNYLSLTVSFCNIFLSCCKKKETLCFLRLDSAPKPRKLLLAMSYFLGFDNEVISGDSWSPFESRFRCVGSLASSRMAARQCSGGPWSGKRDVDLEAVDQKCRWDLRCWRLGAVFSSSQLERGASRRREKGRGQGCSNL